MSVSVCLLRGVNVGGRHRLPMEVFRLVLADLGATDVRTYIQSGNAVFRGRLDPGSVSAAVETRVGFRPHALMHDLSSYEAILAANPFADKDGVHVYFCDGAPLHPGPGVLALADAGERVVVTGAAAFLLAPNGIGRSRLAARLDRALGVPVTVRNWRSAVALRDMARALA